MGAGFELEGVEDGLAGRSFSWVTMDWQMGQRMGAGSDWEVCLPCSYSE